MTPERTLVLVNYFAADLLGSAIASAHQASRTRLRVVVVDNSGDAVESARLRSLPVDEIIDAPENPGYGAGANMGARNAEGVIIVANPDVEFFPGSIDRLVDEVTRDGVVAAGPKFVWDREGEWLLPPPDLPTVGRALDRLAAGRSRWWAERWLARRQRERSRFWLRHQPADERVLSGAVLCLRAEAFHAVGGFDPGYRLYFEEIDLLERLRRRGGRIRYVPAAVCRHLYNQSAGKSGSEAGALYARSQRRYYERHFGSWVGKLLLDWRGPLRLGVPAEIGFFDTTVWQGRGARGEGRGARKIKGRRYSETGFDFPRPSSLAPHPSTPGEGEWIVEASPLADFSSAAGRFTGSEEVRVPSEICDTLQSSELYVRVVERSSGRPIRSLRLRRGAALH